MTSLFRNETESEGSSHPHPVSQNAGQNEKNPENDIFTPSVENDSSDVADDFEDW